MSKFCFFFLTFIAGFQLSALAQRNWGGGVDEEDLHFGFTFQYISSEYKILKRANWRAAFTDNTSGIPQDYATDTINSISSPTSPGFGLGFVSNLRMGKNADLRFTPALSFSDRLIDYNYANSISDQNDPEIYIQKKVQSTLVDFPLGIKIKSDRQKNFRAYLIAGAKYSIDIASKKKTDDAEDPPVNKLVKNNRNILWYEAGFGFDLYFEFFKLSPELKLSNSFRSVLDDRDRADNPYTTPLDKLFLRNLQFSLYFE